MLNKISNRELQAIRAIRNHLMKHGKMPSVRELMKELGYKSPRSASVIVQELLSKGIISKKKEGGFQLKEFEFDDVAGDRAQTVKIPLLGTVACGTPIFAEENVEAEIPVSVKLVKSNQKYFLLRASGDSMNKKGINNGDLVLIRQQQTAENGQDVVALIDDEATIKEFHHYGDKIILKPKSTDNSHQPIILTSDFKVQGVVETVIKI
jgi:repressor LexA